MAPPTGVSWGEHFQSLQQKYPTPADVPNLDLPPTVTAPPATWSAWAKAWKAYYDTTDPASHKFDDNKPNMPPPGASNEEWGKWVKDLSAHAEKK